MSAWTTERPTEEGLYYKRSTIIDSSPQCVRVYPEHETGALIWENFDTEWDWVHRPDAVYEWQPVQGPRE